MKKIKILFIALLFPVLAFSQGAEIIPFVGYMFGGSVNFYDGKYKITDGMDYGVSVLVPVRHVVDVEINYTRMDSEGKYTDYNFPSLNETMDVSTNYFQIGVVKAFSKNNPKITPFGSFSLGATWLDINDPQFDDVWMFSITAGLGVKFMFSDHVGVMLRGRFMMPMIFGGLGFYAGTGGSGISMNSYAAILQGDFNGGLIIKLGN